MYLDLSLLKMIVFWWGIPKFFRLKRSDTILLLELLEVTNHLKLMILKMQNIT